MASTAPARSPSLHPDNWLRAAEKRLSEHGIESVRIEVLARDLGLSKGSFYWHFRDRGEMLDTLLARWQDGEIDWLNADGGAGAATRWARFVERTVDPGRMRMEVALRAWARADQRVAARVAAVEERKSRLISDVLREIGFAPTAADSWSEVVWVICLGWLDRATRDRQFELAGRGLGEMLSEFILAASTRAAGSNG
jgi:AcrR family transcriptional regulator